MNHISQLLAKTLLLPAALLSCVGYADAKTVKIDKKFMNVPLLRTNDGNQFREFKLLLDGEVIGLFTLPYAAEKADYYSGTDMSLFKGKNVELQLSGEQKDLDAIIFSDKIIEETPSYSEEDRPQYHFSARRGWINDPNGLIYQDGTYHMYYQHNPFNIYWQNMSWGHATSTDLVHWEEQPVVLMPLEHHRGGACFSGAAIIDEKNLLGKKTGESDPILAFYLRTGTGLAVAYSNDKGQSFTDYEGNPIIKNGSIRIDTPRPVWHEESQKWVAPTYDSYQAENGEMKRCVGFYSSSDLVNWQKEGRVEHIGEYNVHGDELCGCVDFFQMESQDEKGKLKWVMIFIDGSYIVGDFDGKNFYTNDGKIATTEDRTTNLVIHNFFYATMTWYNAPNNRRVQTAWFTRGHTTEKSVFSERFTLPSELTLHGANGQYSLTMNPIVELQKLRSKSMVKKNISVEAVNKLLGKLDKDLYEYIIEFEAQEGDELSLTVRGQRIVYNATDAHVSLNGVSSPLKSEDGLVKLHIFVDRNTVEIYGNGGKVYLPVVCSEMFRQGKDYSMESKLNGKLKRFELHELKSIWKK